MFFWFLACGCSFQGKETRESGGTEYIKILWDLPGKVSCSQTTGGYDVKPNPDHKDPKFKGPLENISSPHQSCGRDKRLVKRIQVLMLHLPFLRNTPQDRGELPGGVTCRGVTAVGCGRWSEKIPPNTGNKLTLQSGWVFYPGAETPILPRYLVKPRGHGAWKAACSYRYTTER